MKQRLDVYLHLNNYYPSRESAKQAIKAKLVLINEQLIVKPGETIDTDIVRRVKIRGELCPYASRGGLKLKEAIDQFNLELSGAIVLDVGASTGGFTDCALKHDASKVYALDVGQNQLVNKLRQDSRVVVYEKVNFRNIEKNFFDDKFDLITMDVSFISAKLLTENVVKNLKQGGVFICLIKPQFEAGISAPRNSKGVITRKDIHYDVVMSFIKDCSNKQLYVNEVIYSPIKGGSGNVEFLAKITLNNKIIVSAEQVKNLIF